MFNNLLFVVGLAKYLTIFQTTLHNSILFNFSFFT
jgi:hypothetical protein